MAERFFLTHAHIKALRQLAFMATPAQPQPAPLQEPSLIMTDALASFSGRSPAHCLATWLGLHGRISSEEQRISRQQDMIDFFWTLPQAVSIGVHVFAAHARATLPLSYDIKNRCGLAQLVGYAEVIPCAGDHAGCDLKLPRLDSAAASMLAAMAQDPWTRFPNLRPLLDGTEPKTVSVCIDAQQLDWMMGLEFDWAWPNRSDALSKAELEDSLFAPARQTSLLDYLHRMPSLVLRSSCQPQNDKSQNYLPNAALYALGLNACLAAAPLRAGVFQRVAQGGWKTNLQVAA